ncbi:MAG: hypothetical protein JWR74_2990 [Polaromonas sp.]|jgi:hypothetical protein|nr:hypothetical protein [Polaromonas sp.]
MFLNQVKKDDRVSRLLLWMIGSLLFVSLLAALFYVIDGQVEQARLRQAQLDAEQNAISGCTASYLGVLRAQCIKQVKSNALSYATANLKSDM